jgi:hypothetical protein
MKLSFSHYGEYLESTGTEWQNAGEHCIMRSSRICTCHQMLLEWLNQGA